VGVLAIRPGERRDTWTAFATLFGLIASHAVLETARDALFLSRVPAAHLPLVFLAIAALSIAVVARRARGASARRLSGWMLGAAVVTAAFSRGLGAMGAAGVYALYVWSGLLVSLVLVDFWTLVGSLFSVTQAKRLFGVVGAGSVLGAIAGSGAAGALARRVGPEELLLVAAAGLAVSAALPFLFRDGGDDVASAPSAPVPGDDAAPAASTLAYVLQNPYPRGLAIAVLASTMALTVSDFVFKSAVARAVPREELSAFLGTLYFALNLVSLVCQLLLVPWLVRRASLGVALAVLPCLLAVSGLGVALGGAFGAVLAVKAWDGALRHSLHRTASELAFLPLSDESRRRVKAFVDVIAQRGGQIAASLLLLGLGLLPAGQTLLAAVLVVLAIGWVIAALTLREPYLELYRTRLQAGRVPHLEEFPDLDVASLEALLSALDSEKDNEVLAALGVLEREGKVDIIPALTLYHPSVSVVTRALAIFARAGRKPRDPRGTSSRRSLRNLVHVIDRVLEHPSPAVRAAAIAARSVLDPDPAVLLERLAVETSDEVRAAIVVNLIASGSLEEAACGSGQGIDAILREGSAQARLALAEAIGRRGAAGFETTLLSLSTAAEPEIRVAAVAAMGRAPSPTLLPRLVERLGDEATRPSAEEALLAYGGAAEGALEAALHDTDRPAAIRRRVPRAMSLQRDPARATATLLASVVREPDGTVQYQILRALQRLVRRSGARLDRPTLDAAIARTLGDAFRALERRITLSRSPATDDQPGRDLMVALLRDQEKNGIERLFLMLGLLHPGEDLAQIHRALEGGKDARATSTELLENILSEPLRSAVLGLVDDLPDAERLARAGAFHRPASLSPREVCTRLVESDAEPEAVREIAAFHREELALGEVRA